MPAALLRPVHLVGVSEVASMLECPKQQVTKLQHRADFPEPVVTLAATPVWDSREITEFKSTWKRRKSHLTVA